MSSRWILLLAGFVIGGVVVGGVVCAVGNRQAVRQQVEIAQFKLAQVIRLPGWLGEYLKRVGLDSARLDSVEFVTDPALTREVKEWRARAEVAELRLQQLGPSAIQPPSVVAESATAVELANSWAAVGVMYRHGRLTWLASKPPAVQIGSADGLDRVWTLTGTASGMVAVPRRTLFGAEWTFGVYGNMISPCDTLLPEFAAGVSVRAERGALFYEVGPCWRSGMGRWWPPDVRAEIGVQWKP